MKLSYHTADGSFRAVDLAQLKDSIVLGRDRQMAQMVIPDPQVSRSHCVISRKGNEFSVEDLGSRNGTWVNGSRIKQCIVKRGDIVRIGGTDIQMGSAEGEASEDPLLGKNLDGFELQEVLGQGSYGTVYRGLQVNLGRSVAVKILDHKHSQSEEQTKAFLEEARRAGRLNHPNVVQVHDVRQAEKLHILIMELCTGGSTADKLRVEGPLEEPVLCSILEDMGHALSYAESQRLVHRDVKPDNLLVNGEGVFKLADLGIAAPISKDGMAHQANTFGSAHYVAPEQAKGGAIDGRADIYALGASMWHLATGEPMFEGSARQIVAHHLNTEPPDIAELASQISAPLADLIMSMISKDPADRPASGDEVAEAARSVRSGEHKSGLSGVRRISTSSARTGIRRRVRRVRRRRR
jgi:serine/threonine-protein kinase